MSDQPLVVLDLDPQPKVVHISVNGPSLASAFFEHKRVDIPTDANGSREISVKSSDGTTTISTEEVDVDVQWEAGTISLPCDYDARLICLSPGVFILRANKSVTAETPEVLLAQ